METKAEAEGRAAAETQATNDRRDKEGITLGRITLIEEAQALMWPVLRTSVAKASSNTSYRTA
jgi:hypothetical protein